MFSGTYFFIIFKKNAYIKLYTILSILRNRKLKIKKNTKKVKK